MENLIEKIKKINIIYECINCQRTTKNPHVVECIDILDNICIEYYCESCCKYLK